MKKILFLLHLGNIKKSSGILEKVINQSNSMKNLGIHYKTFIFYRPSQKDDTLLFDKYEHIKFVPIAGYEVQKNVLKKIYLEEKMYLQYISTAKKESGNYDFIYVRYNPLYHTFIKFCNMFKNKIIFEHNSIESSEYSANKNKLYLVKEKICGKLVRKNAKNYICVSKEIYNYQKNLYPKDIIGEVIPNGINVKGFKKRVCPIYDGKHLNILFVGNIRYWHGVERMISSIEAYHGSTQITLNICGLSNEEDTITPLINKIKTKNKIIQCGYKTKEELDEYFNTAHIAMGCLAAYKKNINHASTLKNREYFSRAIPIIFCEVDDDISVKENDSLYLNIQNNGNLIDIEQVVSFVKEFYKNGKTNTDKIRAFAEKNLDYNEKIKKLKKLLER